MIKLELIQKIDYFASLSDTEKADLANAMMQRYHHKGDKIITMGEQPSDGFYIIEKGEVRVEKNGQHIALLGAGQFFGEMALITSEPRTSDVIANSDEVSVYYIDQEAFDRLKTNMPKEIQDEIMRRIMENFKKGI